MQETLEFQAKTATQYRIYISFVYGLALWPGYLWFLAADNEAVRGYSRILGLTWIGCKPIC
jgi:hypothetical protein